MAAFSTGTITEIVATESDLVKALVALEDGLVEAHGYPRMLGPIEPGHRVVVNTTGLRLGLGTGGVGFLLWNLDGPGPEERPDGHIVKMRYTPWQTNVLAAEEPSSPHHDALARAQSIDGMPVVACGLHSQVAGVAAGVKAAAPAARVGYLMSDGGALPLPWSDLVRRLTAAGLLDVTCTHGHAFGGDLEAVNVFSGLAALRIVGGVDVAVAAMGPGTAGTGSVLGSSSLEQGQALDATSALGGRAIACLRISFADRRERHRGVSHHTLTSLRLVARERCTVAVPELPERHAGVVREQLREGGVAARHDMAEADGGPGLGLLEEAGVRPVSMGRTVAEAPELFLAASAAGSVASRHA